ncbi:hypothetical protein ACRAWD_04430 [Caulobacter segnis]
MIEAHGLRRLRYFAELFAVRAVPMRPTSPPAWPHWHGAGEHAWLFDDMRPTAWTCGQSTLGFDMTQLLDDPALRTPAMMYLFHRVEQRLDGHPTLIVIDEGLEGFG